MKKQVHFFQYHLPADNHRRGMADVVIDCQSEWMGSYYSTDPTRPVVINVEPIKSRLENYTLRVVKDWHQVFTDIEKLAETYFASCGKEATV